jgi:hypothetical protein
MPSGSDPSELPRTLLPRRWVNKLPRVRTAPDDGMMHTFEGRGKKGAT